MSKAVESKEMNAAEAVYGFAAWLTCRTEKTVMSSQDDAACIANLVKDFCETNKLKEPRDRWEKHLTHPADETYKERV